MFFKNCLIRFLNSFPASKSIIFESAPDLSDNTKGVFDELIRQGVNRNYRLCWICFDKNNRTFPRIKNVKYLLSGSIAASLILRRSKVAICCNRFVVSTNKRAINFYLGHGNPLKNTKEYYTIPDTIDYILASSNSMRDLRCSFYGYNQSKFFPLGYPRNDILTKTSVDLHQFFETKFKKIVVWYPTVRQFKSGRVTGSEHPLPVIWNDALAIELNEYAKACEVLIVVKPHFAQKLESIRSLELSNLVFIDDSFFVKNNITSYQFVGSCDALLTDYSSIYYDYTLCDKPIGLIWEDYDQYKANPGFAVDMDYMMKGGVKIYNFDDFKSFISDISQGIDKLKTERREIRDFANVSTDGRNAERVVDFIVKTAGLKI